MFNFNKENKKSLSINYEVLRIENGKYFVDAENCLKECSREEFEKALKEYENVCLTSYNKKLKETYLELLNYFKKEGV